MSDTQNLPAVVEEPTRSLPVEPGSRPLRTPAHERYARARALLRPKIEAYRYAFEKEESADDTRMTVHCMRGNASRLERRRAVAERIAYLCRQDVENLAEKRRRLEERLWLIHEFDIGDLYETVEREKRDKKGRLVVDQNGKPVMVRYQQIRHAADIPPDIRQAIQEFGETETGRLVVKSYSKMQANIELRRLLGIGATVRTDDDDMGRLSDQELLNTLAQQARELGIEVDLTYRMGRREDAA
jgi:hypothetical protein